MSDDVLVRVDNVSKRFCRSLKKSLWYGLQDLGSELGGHRHGGGAGLPQSSRHVELRKDEFWAVKDVSFELRRGECLGLIGRNGAGKTTLLRMLNGLIKPDTGLIRMSGNIGALIALEAGFNPILTGRENIRVNLSVLGVDGNVDALIDSIIDFAEIDDFIDSPVQTYSSGMRVRLGFSSAIHMSPDILLVDEVLAVGDLGFRQKAYNAISKLIKTSCVIFVSHSLPQVGKVCTQGIVMEHGRVALQSMDITDVIDGYNNLFESSSTGKIYYSGASRLRSIRAIAHDKLIVIRASQLEKGLISPSLALAQGSKLEMEIQVYIQDDIQEFAVGVTFFNQEMSPVAAASSLIGCNQFLRSGNGLSIVKMTIPSLPLCQGLYSATLGFMGSFDTASKPTERLLICEDFLKIHVSSKGSLAGSCPVLIDSSWIAG